MTKITIIGSGNLAQHLISAFLIATDIEIVQVYTRNKIMKISGLAISKMVTNFLDLKEADLYIIAVSDNAIASVAAQLPFENRLVVHTSGAASLDYLTAKNRQGVFYPLQTFTKGKTVNFQTIPICLEAVIPSDYLLLQNVALAISSNVHAINSHQRKALHVAAVFVNNFTNHLYQLGSDICNEYELPFDILKPLIIETAQKVVPLTPKEAQTGPAQRHDTATIASHKSFLTSENQITIYNLLTESIQNHGKEL